MSLKAATLHSIQGATAEPGMIFHWVFPRLVSQAMRWLAIYVALSRVPSLAQLRSVGLTTRIREVIESGPPEGLPAAHQELLGDCEVATKALAAQALQDLKWV